MLNLARSSISCLASSALLLLNAPPQAASIIPFEV